MCTVNQQQLFDLKKSSLRDGGNSNSTTRDLASPKTNLPFTNPKGIKTERDTPHQHSYGTRSKTQTNAIFEASDIGEDNMAYSGWRSLASSVFTPWL